MEFIIYTIVGALVGSFIVLFISKLLSPSTNYKSDTNVLIKQSEERIQITKKHSEELDRLLQEFLED